MTQNGSDPETGPAPIDDEMDDAGDALDAQTTPDVALPAELPLPPDVLIDVNGQQVGLSALLESLLFVADTPVEPLQVAKALDIERQVVEDGLARLDRIYRENGRGLRLLERDDTFQLVTLPQAAPAIEIFLSLDLTTKLSGPALEALAVIAYRQPVTRAQVEAVRGVDCAGVLRSLLLRGLVEEAGRLDTVGRPILYGVTDLFMHHFGLTGMGELPPLEETAADTLWAATELVDGDDGDIDTHADNGTD